MSPRSSIRVLPLRPRRLNHRPSPRTLRPPPGWPPQIPPVPSPRRSRISTPRSPRSADRHQPCQQPARQAWPPPHRVAARAPIHQPPWLSTARFSQHSKQTQANPATRADPSICYPPRSPDGSLALNGQLATSPPEPPPLPPNPHPATNRSNPPTPSYRPPPTPATTGSSHPLPTPLRAHQLAPHDSSSGSTALWAGWRNGFESAVWVACLPAWAAPQNDAERGRSNRRSRNSSAPQIRRTGPGGSADIQRTLRQKVPKFHVSNHFFWVFRRPASSPIEIGISRSLRNDGITASGGGHGLRGPARRAHAHPECPVHGRRGCPVRERRESRERECRGCRGCREREGTERYSGR